MEVLHKFSGSTEFEAVLARYERDIPVSIGRKNRAIFWVERQSSRMMIFPLKLIKAAPPKK